MAQQRYITVAELELGFDSRLLAQLSSDNNVPAAVNEGNDVLQHAIDRASADIESAALRGERYSLEDLVDLRDDDDFTLKGLAIDLAKLHLYEIRGWPHDDLVARIQERALKMIEALANGSRIFRDSPSAAAGVPEVHLVPASRRARTLMVSDSAFFPPARTLEAI